MLSPEFIAVSALIIDWLIRIGLSLRVIMRRRSAGTSIAWLAVIFAIPFLGGVLYLLVGENRLGNRRARLRTYRARALEELAGSLWKRGVDWTVEPDKYRHIARLGSSFTDRPPLGCNQLRLLANDKEMLAALIEDIDNARHHCHIVTYIWQPTGQPEVVMDALIRASERGVECRVLVDAIGGKAFFKSKHPARMRRAGVQVTEALPVNPVRMLFARLDLRNHRKLSVIDGRIAYVGSQNMTDKGFRIARRPRIGPWIDATARVEGPAAQSLAITFLGDWEMDAREQLALADYLPELEVGEGAVTQTIPSGPGLTPSAIHKLLIDTLHTARSEIIITTPYFVPDDSMRAAIETAAMRGVDVSIIVPRDPAAPIVNLAATSHYEDLLRAGVRIHRHNRGLLHSKTVTIDRDFSIISSANFDMRSFWLNFEVTLLVYDTDFASQLRLLQRSYLNHATEVEIEQWRQRPFIRRFAENVCRIIGPIL